RGLADRRVVEYPEQAVGFRRVPLGSSGLRIHRPRPRLAVASVCRTAHLARPDTAPHPADAAAARRKDSTPALAVCDFERLHRDVLWRGSHLGTAHAPLDGGILAMVGRPPLGR